MSHGSSFWASLLRLGLVALGYLSLTQLAQAEEINYQHGISLLHELKYPPDFEHFEYANPLAPKGGTLVLSASAYIRNFSGAPAQEVPNAQGSGRTFDRLFIRTADELSGIYGWLADGIALSSDRKSLFIRIHEKAYWHDGVPITTKDVKFSMDETFSTVFGQVYFDSWIKSVEVVNPREMVIHHRETFTNANLVSLVWFRIRPAHYWSTRDPRKTTLVPPVASGPYRVAASDSGYVRYERVEDYWGRDIPVNRGRFNFDTIHYDVYRDANVAREGFRKGLFDVYFEADIGHWNTSYDTPAKERGWVLQETRPVQKFIGLGAAITLNTKREQLRDVRVREALTWAMDFEWQNRVFSYGLQTRASSYFAKSRFAATGMPSASELKLLAPYRDQLPPRTLTEVFQLPVSNGSGLNRSALERARILFAEAGWTVRDGHLVNAHGEPFKFELMTQNPAYRRILLPYVESLKVLGIDARLRLLDSVMTINLLRERDFDAYLRNPSVLNPPIGELRAQFGSKTAVMPMGGNLSGIRSGLVDALIEEAQRADTIEAMTAACRALDRVLLWGFYHIPLNVPDDERFLRWDKFGRPEGEAVARYEHLVGSSLRVLDSWWFDTEKAGKIASAGK